MNIIRLVSVVAALSVVGAAGADTIWVSKTGDDAYEGDDIGSEEHPFATIQAGVDKARSGDTVKVLPGDYDAGGAVDGYGSSNRVSIAKKIYLKSTGGAAVTRIVGKHDSGDTANDGTNLAGDGVRCVYVLDAPAKTDKKGYGTVVEGFTLVDGYNASQFGGAAYVDGGTVSADNGVYFVDCVISGCSGSMKSNSSNGAVRGGTLVRCRVSDCSAWSTLVNTWAWNCVFLDNTATRAVFGYSYGVNCSIGFNDCTYVHFGTSLACGCVSSASKPSLRNNGGDYAAGWTNSVLNTAGTMFVDAANADWRLLPTATEAIGLADAEDLTAYVNFDAAIVPIAFTDYNGKPLPAAGKINAGAVQDVRSRLAVAEFPYGGVTMTGVVVGEQWIDEDADVTFAPSTGKSARHCLGIVTNGVTELFADHPGGISFTIRRSNADVSVEPAYSTHWYVDASRPDDSGDGFTPQTAKKTLADACTNTVTLAGDTIHVAAGVYDTGVCAPPEGRMIGARAAVPAGVTLLADGSVDETIIEGAEATEPNRDLTDAFAVYHTGTDAVRCVFLNDNSAVRGFTLRNGVTRGLNTATGAGTSNPDFCGGGVSGSHTAGAGWHLHVVENCVISNCVAAWGGAADGVRLVGCRLIDNFATRYGRHSNYCSEEGSCFSGLSGLPNATVSYITFYPQRMLNSTYCANGSDGGFNNDVATPPTNCVFLGKLTTSEKSDVSRRSEHCIFIRYTTEVVKPENILTDTCLFLDNAAAFGLDADFRPASTNSPVVDFCAAVPDRLSALDPAGVQRVYNGRIDCGAYEYDWRGNFAADLMPKGKIMTVAVADGCVQEVDGKVCLPAGKLVLRFTSDKVDPDDLLATVSVRVPDGGTLTVTSGETAIVPTPGADAGLWDYPIRKTATQFDVTFEYAGEGYAEFQGVQKVAGLVLIFR